MLITIIIHVFNPNTYSEPKHSSTNGSNATNKHAHIIEYTANEAKFVTLKILTFCSFVPVAFKLPKLAVIAENKMLANVVTELITAK